MPLGDLCSFGQQLKKPSKEVRVSFLLVLAFFGMGGAIAKWKADFLAESEMATIFYAE